MKQKASEIMCISKILLLDRNISNICYSVVNVENTDFTLKGSELSVQFLFFCLIAFQFI